MIFYVHDIIKMNQVGLTQSWSLDKAKFYALLCCLVCKMKATIVTDLRCYQKHRMLQSK